MKKIAILTIAVVFAAFTMACAAVSDTDTTPGSSAPAGETSSSSPSIAPSPSPEPEGVEAVFGKKLKIAAVSNGTQEQSALFFAGIQSEAASFGIEVQTEAAADGFDASIAKYADSGVDAVIAYLPLPAESYAALETLESKGIPVSLFEMRRGEAPKSFSHTWYNPEKQEEILLNAALEYPPHTSPVRMILMFQNKDTAAYKQYAKLSGEGKIFKKELYLKSDKGQAEPKDWFAKILKKYYAGMIDAVFAEDETLAMGALDALGDRTDMEVFSVGLSTNVLSRMRANPEAFAQVAGANAFFAGVLNVRIAASMIKGGSPVTEEFLPVTVNAADLKDKDDAAAMMALVAPADTVKYNEPWMDELRSYYAK